MPTVSRAAKHAARLVPGGTEAHAETVARGGEFSVRNLVRDVVDRFEEHDLLTSASAMSFQVFTALVPLLLFAFALLGFLSLDDIWRDNVAPSVRGNLSPAAFHVVNDTATKVLSSGQFFWMTAGFVLTVWQISGAVRAVMGALNRIYRVDGDRPLRRRLLVSTGLALVVGAALLGAVGVVTLGPLLYDGLGQPLNALLFLLRWTIAGVLMLLAVGMLLRYGPARARPMRWVSFGTMLVIGSWIAMSIGFGAYLRFVASYDSVFGNLATVVVLMGYIYLSGLVFLTGAQVDAIVRRRVESV
jgi:membrane protein